MSRHLLEDDYGSIHGVGRRFQPRRINDLEMVDLTGIEPVTS